MGTTEGKAFFGFQGKTRSVPFTLFYVSGQHAETYAHEYNTIQDKEAFMKSLGSAIHHLHSLDLAHNDLNPANILVAEDGTPILIDFGSARKIGEKLSMSRGTKAGSIAR